jgi:hypothetical protein
LSKLWASFYDVAIWALSVATLVVASLIFAARLVDALWDDSAVILALVANSAACEAFYLSVSAESLSLSLAWGLCAILYA